MSDRPHDEVFAQQLLKVGLVSEAQVKAALQVQAERALKGEAVALGLILVEQGLLTSPQRESLEKKLETQREDAKRLGPYRIIKKLGEGGMGAVYLAEDPASGSRVALKVLPKVAAKEEDAIRRFMRELDSARKLDHPNIVRASGGGEDKGFHYYVMEYVEGETLGRRLKRDEFFPPDEATKTVLQIAHGLKYAHDQGFIHRDIKPDNIILSREGAAKILDMGLSKNIDDAQSFRTVTGVALGTPHYISPEQARADKAIDGRADIYSLGATYYHLVTGETPFHGTTAIEIIAQHLNKQLPDPRDIRDGIPDGVVHIIRRMMAKKPQHRYHDCAELLTDLELVLGGRNPSSQALEAAHSAVGLPMQREARERYRAERLKARRGTARATTRSRSNSTGLVIGGAVAAVVAVIVLVVALGANNPRPAERPSETAKVPPREPPKPATTPQPSQPVAPVKSHEETRQETAARRKNEIEQMEKSGRYTPDEARRHWGEFAKEYADTPQGKTVESWLKSKKPEPTETPPPGEQPKVPDVPKPVEPPKSFPPEVKPPENPPAEPVVKPTPREMVKQLAERVKELEELETTEKLGQAQELLVDRYLALGDEAVASGNYDTGTTIGRKAEALAKRLKKVALIMKVNRWNDDFVELKKAYNAFKAAESTLKSSPENAAANLTAGEYLCLSKGDWEKGLPMLARGSDAKLRAAAQEDLKNPTDALAMAKVGDGWWTLASRETNRTYKQQLELRAANWYQRALPNLQSDTKSKIEQRVAQVFGSPEPTEWLILGPFDSMGGVGGRGFDFAFPPETGIDLNAKLATKAGARSWTLARASLTGQQDPRVAFLDLTNNLAPSDRSIGYALIHVRAVRQMEARLLCGCDDGMKVWLNGTQIHAARRLVLADQDQIPINLKAGWNRLLFKIINDQGPYSLSMRITDPDKRPVPGLSYHPYGDLQK